jgi:hypothetical protein
MAEIRGPTAAGILRGQRAICSIGLLEIMRMEMSAH